MIVRILGEGQFQLTQESLAALNDLDAKVEETVTNGDETGFRAALAELLGAVREQGSLVPDDDLEPSDFMLPHADASLAEVRDLLSGDGLIPG